MYVLATLYALRQHIGLETNDSSEDVRLLDALSSASASIERYTQRQLLPSQQSIAHTINLNNRRELLLNQDLLSLQSVSNGDNTSIALEDILQVNMGILTLINGAQFIYEDTIEKAITVNGIWGYHPNWASAWVDSEDAIHAGDLSSSATTFTVNDATAGTKPRFQVGQLIRIEDEYLMVTTIDSNSLTVERGVQGTSAVSHSNGTSIEIYQVPADIAQLTLRWALWLYREPDSFMYKTPAILLESIAGLRRISVGS
ncbi:MAG: hypothetical protein Phog2KO_27990 [Phototrophicaceae bacterium]